MVLSVLLVAAAGGLLASVVRAHRALRREPWLRSGTRLRSLPKPVLVIAVLAMVAGLVGGVWLASEVQEGKERRSEARP